MRTTTLNDEEATHRDVSALTPWQLVSSSVEREWGSRSTVVWLRKHERLNCWLPANHY